MANCAVCRQDLSSEQVCSRCGSDNSNVPDVTLGYFTSIWAILSFLLIFIPLFMLLPGVFSWIDKILQPIASLRVAGPIALLLCLVIAFYVFSMRDDLHTYGRTLRFKEKPGRPLTLWALTFFIVAVVLVFFLGFTITSKDLIVGPEGYGPTQVEGLLVYGSTAHITFKLLMTGCLIMVFACFALASGLMAAFEYGVYVDERCPDPIYLNEKLLFDVVLRSVHEHLGPDVRIHVTNMKRLPDAGISLSLHHEGELTVRDKVRLLEEKGWLVEASLWGRLIKMTEQSPRSIQVKEQAPT